MAAKNHQPGKVKLVPIPKRLLRPDLQRRLPAARKDRFRDLTGQKFKHLEVIGFAGFLNRDAAWLCQCACGQRCIARTLTIAHRDPTCGCRGAGFQRHGGSHLSEYSAWRNLCRLYADQLCERWRDFKLFRRDVGARPKRSHIIGRVDRNKPFAPGNARWMSRKEAGVVRGPKLYYTHAGETLSYQAWARRLGISFEGLRQRIAKCQKYGASVSQAFTTPAGESMPCARKRAGNRHRRRKAT